VDDRFQIGPGDTIGEDNAAERLAIERAIR
jgi:hypothetical protein